ncbi:hypothetical protein VTK73DRAFT_8113 [Phialemonium thermophilum]|uniref:Uncharacterized protein n=1 Tax=Phialemonium thermophilum TaxID=223376 RepID=A0ABR3WAE4_9PEZI
MGIDATPHHPFRSLRRVQITAGRARVGIDHDDVTLRVELWNSRVRRDRCVVGRGTASVRRGVAGVQHQLAGDQRATLRDLLGQLVLVRALCQGPQALDQRTEDVLVAGDLESHRVLSQPQGQLGLDHGDLLLADADGVVDPLLQALLGLLARFGEPLELRLRSLQLVLEIRNLGLQARNLRLLDGELLLRLGGGGSGLLRLRLRLRLLRPLQERLLLLLPELLLLLLQLLPQLLVHLVQRLHLRGEFAGLLLLRLDLRRQPDVPTSPARPRAPPVRPGRPAAP